MIKSKFFKNLYQTISFSLSVSVIVFFLLLGYFASLSYENNDGWLLLLVALIVIILFFMIGFFWFFQIVEIDTEGISTKILGKTLRKVNWDNIKGIKHTSVMRNPAYVVSIENQKDLNLDSRKKIRFAIEYFGNENMQKIVKEMT